MAHGASYRIWHSRRSPYLPRGRASFSFQLKLRGNRGFFREQNLDIKYLVTRTEADRAALASGNIDYTLRAGSTLLSAVRGLPVRVDLHLHNEALLGSGGSSGN